VLQHAVQPGQLLLRPLARRGLLGARSGFLLVAALFAVLADFPHVLQTSLRVWLDPGERRRHGVHYVVSLAVIGTAVGTLAVLGRFVVVVAVFLGWQILHVVKQHIGMVSVYAAKAAYRARLEELREELDEAESFNDPERAAAARKETQFLAQELAGAVGLGGRDRKAASNAERARVAVTKAVRATVKRIGEMSPDLGQELVATIRTGTFCSYEPDPRRPVSWDVQSQ